MQRIAALLKGLFLSEYDVVQWIRQPSKKLCLSLESFKWRQRDEMRKHPDVRPEKDEGNPIVIYTLHRKTFLLKILN